MSDVPKLFRVTIEVADLDRAAAFYTTLFGAEGRRIRGGRHYFDCGPAIVALLDATLAEREPALVPGDYYFSVADLEAVHARAASLDALSGEDVHDASGGDIATRPWGERSFYAVDPFGNGLCFVDEKTVYRG